ncbi:MAG TPA: IS630 family transposase, partial [Terriglobia bacterium]
ATLQAIRKARSEQRRRTVRAGILLDAASGEMSDQAMARAHRVNRNTVVLCVNKCLRFGWKAALGELPRSGRPRRLRDEATTWVLHCACQKPKELGYSYELWTYGLLTQHLRQRCEAAGYPELRRLSRSKLHKILTQAELRPHKIRYYVERRDPDFEAKMAAVLHVYKEVAIINEGLLRGELREAPLITISYDEKPGVQALAPKSPDLPPVPGQHPSPTRDYEYERLGTVSLLAGLDLHSGQVVEIVRETHKSSDFIAFLQKLDARYPAGTPIRLLLDNHSAHISRETQAYLQTVPGRFRFAFTPTHGSWLNLVETLFSKMARSMLRGVRVATKEELVQRIHQYFDQVNADPVVFRWTYKMDEVTID